MNISKLNFNLSSKQLLILSIILVFEVIGTISSYKLVLKNEKETLTQDFTSISKEIIAKIEKEISLNLEALNSINALYTVTDSISREQFKIFNANVLNRISSIQALEWIPLVKFEDKLLYESMAYIDGLEEFMITERLRGEMVPVANREVYYPVFYMEPMAGNEKALGFDLGSDSTRLLALQKAVEFDFMVATSRIILVQEKTEQKGILVFSPVIKGAEVMGFALGVFRVGDLITRALGDMSSNIFNLTVYDVSSKEGNQLLAQRNYENGIVLPDDAVFKVPLGVNHQQIIKIADREWLIISTPTQSYLNSFSHSDILILTICIILSIGIFYYFYSNFKERNLQIQNQLILETKVLERTEELEEYAYVVSHDLKSPLRSIEALVNWIKEDNKGKYDKDSLNNFNLIGTTLEKMEQLISDILSHSSINSNSNKLQEVDLNNVVNNLNTTLLIPDNISVNILSTLPTIYGDSVKLQQLFQNLISNAIKYNDKEKGIIEVDVINEKAFYQFSIKDNGLGIEKKFHRKVFKLFQSLNTNKDSTGIGLAIVKKIVSQYGGEIWLKSEIGKGTIFYFTLKK